MRMASADVQVNTFNFTSKKKCVVIYDYDRSTLTSYILSPATVALFLGQIRPLLPRGSPHS